MPHCIRKMLAWHNSIYKTVGPVSVAPPGAVQSRENSPSPTHSASREYTTSTAAFTGGVIG